MSNMYTCDQHAYLEKGIARYLHKVRMDALTEIITQLKKEKKKLRILDIGCGDGAVLRYIVAACDDKDEIIGLDVSDLRLERAKQLLGKRVKFVIGDATNLKYKPGHFDIVMMYHVIEHIPENKRALKESYKVLKKGGHILIGVPHEGGSIGKSLRFIHKGMYKKSQHVHFYTYDSMKQLLEEAGFRNVQIERFGFLFPFYPVHWLILSIRPLFYLGHWITQKVKFTADSLFFVAEK